MRLARRIQIGWQRAVRRVALSSLFLVVAAAVVAVTMVVLGSWIGAYVATSISNGVAQTAVSSIDALISETLQGLGPERPVGAADRARLDAVFLVGNDADTTRLLQIRLRDLDGKVIYESFAGILTSEVAGDFEEATRGNTVSRLGNLLLQPIGPLEAQPLPVLEIHTGLHQRDSEEVFAVADLYYSAKAIIEIQRQVQMSIWALVSAAGLCVVGALYIFVSRIGQTIASQRENLARNLEASRRLADENLTLHSASEQLRLDAALSNEGLLTRVGSDIHDGPIQLLTLLILRLSMNAKAAKPLPEVASSIDEAAELASSAMQELRAISSGLVLPELADLSVEDTVALAIERHEATTGKTVDRYLSAGTTHGQMTSKICAYRIVQEALNNAFWHGDSSATKVVARVADGTLEVEIVNRTGREGLKPDAESLGLRTMRLRVGAVGGGLRVELRESEVLILAQIPLDGGRSSIHLVG
jgi:signal transduction histidine kinase